MILLLLAAVLVVVLVWQGTRTPKTASPQAPPPSETAIRKSKPTPTRVLRPKDLQVVDATIELTQSSTAESMEARHTLGIRNNGELAYRNVNLTFAYLSKEGKPLETRTYTISGPVLSGKTISEPEFVMKTLPRGTSKSVPTILYADIEPPTRDPK
jgi:hypothetical protein